MTHSKAEVEAKLARALPGRPPQRRLEVDYVLRNRAAAPRWFLLPKDTGTAKPATAGGVDAVETYQLNGPTPVVLGRFLGTGGFQALLLPAGAELALRHLPLAAWGEADKLTFEVTIAADLRIGGEPAQAWLKAEVPIAPNPQSGEASASGWKLLGTRRADGNKEQPVAVSGEHRVPAEITL